MLVNSIYDGMNHVAKEGMLLNQRDGVLVLSENVGAHEELRQHAVGVNPFDVGATADVYGPAAIIWADTLAVIGIARAERISRRLSLGIVLLAQAASALVSGVAILVRQTGPALRVRRSQTVDRGAPVWTVSHLVTKSEAPGFTTTERG